MFDNQFGMARRITDADLPPVFVYAVETAIQLTLTELNENLREIYIDAERCPLTYAEFTCKEYLRDRDGTWIDDIPDGNYHSIDAVRYAMMDDVLRG